MKQLLLKIAMAPNVTLCIEAGFCQIQSHVNFHINFIYMFHTCMTWLSVGSGSDYPANPGHSGYFLPGQPGLIHEKNYPDVSQIDHMSLI